MKRRFHVEIDVEFHVKPDFGMRDAARIVEAIFKDRFAVDDGDGGQLLDITVYETTNETQGERR